ncbi:MAG: M73 family metallopeptidase [Oscillospiraceae bacterium]|jgi:hypothetical protein|nr:M73 family metallopeptidase [Oscillospiraceae bacterium]
MLNRSIHHKIKIWVSIACFAITIGLTTSAVFAFFSDIVTGDETITAGTLDLTEDSANFYINGSLTPATAPELAHINPGDTVTAEITVSNTGSKSAWLLLGFTLAGSASGADINSVFNVYEGVGTDGHQLTGTEGVNDVTYMSAGDTIMDGTVETEPGSVGTSVTLTYTLDFSAAAGNVWQGESITIAYTVKALQYRNNPTPDWADAVAL